MNATMIFKKRVIHTLYWTYKNFLVKNKIKWVWNIDTNEIFQEDEKFGFAATSNTKYSIEYVFIKLRYTNHYILGWQKNFTFNLLQLTFFVLYIHVIAIHVIKIIFKYYLHCKFGRQFIFLWPKYGFLFSMDIYIYIWEFFWWNILYMMFGNQYK
jgi:hypothetical protein